MKKILKYKQYFESSENNFDDYLLQIRNGNFSPCTNDMWETIEMDGYSEEREDFNKSNYLIMELIITDDKKEGLINFDDDIIEEFNDFDIELKDSDLYPNHLDFIDYDIGKVYIVKHIT